MESTGLWISKHLKSGGDITPEQGSGSKFPWVLHKSDIAFSVPKIVLRAETSGGRSSPGRILCRLLTYIAPQAGQILPWAETRDLAPKIVASQVSSSRGPDSSWGSLLWEASVKSLWVLPQQVQGTLGCFHSECRVLWVLPQWVQGILSTARLSVLEQSLTVKGGHH